MKEMKSNADLLITHCFLITMNSSREIFQDGAIAIRNGEIIAVGKSDDIENKYAEVTCRKDVKGALVHPGLVDAHEHTGMHLTRGWLPDFFSLQETHLLFEKPLFTDIAPEEEYYGTVLANIEMVLNGTTAFGDTGSAIRGIKDVDNIVEAARLVGIRARTGNFVADVMTDEYGLPMLNSDTEECLKKLEYQISTYPTNSESLVGCWVTLFGVGMCSDTLLREAKKLADQSDTMINMHQSCYDWEVDAIVKQNNGSRPIEYLAELGLLGPKTALVHMIHLDSNEVDLLAKTDTCVVHCPGASTRNAMSAAVHGLFPEMVAQGIPVSLGSDQGNSSDGLDVCRMAYLAAVLHKEARSSTPVISAEQAFEMATINGAKALGLDDKVGSLEVGKRADVVIHNLKHPESHPPFDPLNNLIYSVHSKSVDTVLIEGKTIVENGELQTLDVQEIYRKVDARAQDLAKRMGYRLYKKWPVIQ